MSHRQRIEAALALAETGPLPLRASGSIFPTRIGPRGGWPGLSLDLQRRLDADFIKFTPYGLYSVVDWGVVLDVKGGNRPPVEAEYPIRKAEDWLKLRPMGATEGEYLIVLEAQRIALSEMNQRVPLVQTVFSPLTTCVKLAGRDQLLAQPSPVAAGRARRAGGRHRDDPAALPVKRWPAAPTACSSPARPPTTDI